MALSATSIDADVETVARVLNQANIPCVLWADGLCRLHGIPHSLYYLNFVVPDHLIWEGDQALYHLENVQPCNAEYCKGMPPERARPVPTCHVHWGEYEVGLYRQSDILWCLPPIQDEVSPTGGLKNPPSRNYTVASDRHHLAPRDMFTYGVFQTVRSPVVTLRSHSFAEVCLSLHARNCAKFIGLCDQYTLLWLMRYVDRDGGRLDRSLIREPFKTFYETFLHPPRGWDAWTRELQEALDEEITGNTLDLEPWKPRDDDDGYSGGL